MILTVFSIYSTNKLIYPQKKPYSVIFSLSKPISYLLYIKQYTQDTKPHAAKDIFLFKKENFKSIFYWFFSALAIIFHIKQFPPLKFRIPSRTFPCFLKNIFILQYSHTTLISLLLPPKKKVNAIQFFLLVP